ncbi:hypothetical protein ACVW0Y_002003 [Pseudomonas sp. TE3786]
MRNFNLLVATFFLFSLTTTAHGYSVELATRALKDKLPTDDLVVVETHRHSADSPMWFSSTNSRFQIWMIDKTVEIKRQNPVLPGIRSGMSTFPLLDKLHDLPDQTSGALYDMRLIFNEDILWIEVWPSGNLNSPVASSVTFFGADKETVDYYLNTQLDNVSYANLKQMKTVIQSRYADLYDLKFDNFIHYRPAAKNAIFSVIGTDDE